MKNTVYAIILVVLILLTMMNVSVSSAADLSSDELLKNVNSVFPNLIFQEDFKDNKVWDRLQNDNLNYILEAKDGIAEMKLSLTKRVSCKKNIGGSFYRWTNAYQNVYFSVDIRMTTKNNNDKAYYWLTLTNDGLTDGVYIDEYVDFPIRIVEYIDGENVEYHNNIVHEFDKSDRDNNWRKYEFVRFDGMTYIYIDGVKTAEFSNYNERVYPKIGVGLLPDGVLSKIEIDNIVYRTDRTNNSATNNNCPMSARLQKGDHAEVTLNSGLILRKEPAGEETGIQAFAGKDIMILSNPVCEKGVNWYEIDFLGHRGWCMEGKNGVYYLRKTNGTPTKADPSPKVPNGGKEIKPCRYPTFLELYDKVEVVNTTALMMHQKPNWAPIDINAFPDKTAKITDGPKCQDGSIWWEIDFLGYKGWVTEMSPAGKYYLEKK